MFRDIELAKVDMSFGSIVSEDGQELLPAAVLTIVAVGADIPTLQDDPVAMLSLMMEQVSKRYEEGLIVPEKTYDAREQADGTPK